VTESYDVGVVGLGYVGLTLATALADVGLRVIGTEKRSDVVEAVRAGRPSFREVGLEQILTSVVARGRFAAQTDFEPGQTCPVYIITVGTPLDDKGRARLDILENATRQVAAAMPDDALVVLRSTVMVGTTRNLVIPILEQSGKRFDIAMCPERTLEGNALAELRQLPQIVGADSARARERAGRLFSHLTNQVLNVSSLETAEVIKLADNTYRDVQFGFANEIARLCDAIGVSANEVISIGKLGYPRTNIAQPGLVGGPCLEKDPHILCQSAEQYGLELEVTNAARAVNERQPDECVGFIADELARRGASQTPRIAILGLAFKGVPETDDLRGAMSLRVIEAVKRRLPEVRLTGFDPVVPAVAVERLGLGLVMHGDPLEAMAHADAVIIANNHPSFATLSISVIARSLKPGGFVYDFWNNIPEGDPGHDPRLYFAVGSIRKQPG
jgi:UDP-N-acetyl-D-mannosaminuronic acid dehydrogenase